MIKTLQQPLHADDAGNKSKRGWLFTLVITLNFVSTIAGIIVTYTSNPGVNNFLGVFHEIKSLMKNGEVNLGDFQRSGAWLNDITSPEDVADNWTFYKAPSRNIATMGQSFSKCDRIGSDETIHSSVHWDIDGVPQGKRDLIRVDSDYLRGCSVINVVDGPAFLAYLDQNLLKFGCSATNCELAATALREEMKLLGNLNRGDYDGGNNGVPYILCANPVIVPTNKPASYLVLQKPWHGTKYSYEIQISMCINTPIVDYSYGSSTNGTANMRVFQVESVNDNADVFFAVVNIGGYIGDIFLAFYGILAVGFLFVGIAQVLAKSPTAPYVLTTERAKCPIWFKVPANFSMWLYTQYSGVSQWAELHCNKWKGSEVWMNNYIFIYSSYIYGFMTLRETYITLEIGTYMMISGTQHWSVFVFIAGGMVRLCWSCLFVTEVGCRIIMWGSRAFGANSKTRATTLRIMKMRFWIGYKIEVFLLVTLVGIMLATRGTVTLLTGRNVIPIGDRGPVTVTFWNSENFTDLGGIWAIIFVMNIVIMWALSLNQYARDVSNNCIVSTLASKYRLIGWDMLLVVHTLQFRYEPMETGVDVLVTTCSLGDVIELMYKAGPSGMVKLEGENILNSSEYAYEPSYFTKKVAREKGLTAGVADRTRYLKGKEPSTLKSSSVATMRGGKKVKTISKSNNNDSNEVSFMTEQEAAFIVADECQVHHLTCGGTFKETIFIQPLRNYVYPVSSTESHGRKIVYCDTFGTLPFTRVLKLLDGKLRLKLG